jgi:hypothetical protein
MATNASGAASDEREGPPWVTILDSRTRYRMLAEKTSKHKQPVRT